MQKYTLNSPLIHTYSICAKDQKTGQMGVGVQSHYFSVGSVVPWAESGVGVVATQSFVNKSFGLRGLELLKQNRSPQEALDILLAEDEGRDVRQVSILDTQGRVATHTGFKCIKHAGHFKGNNFSVQANMMLSNKVWPAMAQCFEEYKDIPLPERIIKSLQAAESAGGDIRGKQSAAILIVSGEPAENRWDDTLIDLRVEDHKEPLKELSRLLKLQRTYDHAGSGNLAMEKGETNKAFEEFETVLKMAPDNLEMKYWYAIKLANAQKIDESLPLFKEVFLKDKNWRILTTRLPDAGLLNLNKKDYEQIISLK